MENEINPSSAMMKEVGRVHEGAKLEARGAKDGTAEELAEETPEVEKGEETPEVEAQASEEAPEATPGAAEPEEPIRIGGQVFKNQREAFEYAERVERERELTEAHSAGIREALEATRAAAQPVAEPEDNFEERFYSNPKEALKEVQSKARDEAVAIIKAEQQRENLWTQFLAEYPDIRRKDAERVLNENWETIGRMTDLKKAQSVLAQKVRAEYDEIVSYVKPKTVLADKKQVQSPSGGQPKGVTPKKEERPLDFTSEMRSLFKR